MPLASVRYETPRRVPADYTVALHQAVAAGRRRPRTDAIGEILAGPRSRAETRSFNNFPAIIAAFPRELSEIVRDTTNRLASRASAGAPVARRQRAGDPEAGTLRHSYAVKFFRRRAADTVETGRVEFTAKDPRGHRYARPVETGAVGPGKRRVEAQPFLVPAIIEERAHFVGEIQGLERRLPRP